jgi:dienelactone hydrolase
MRAGLGACAVDLPGHGERFDGDQQSSATAFAVIAQMVGEIDGIITALDDSGGFDTQRIAIGGMSLGGMAALARLCRPHGFRCASVEGATGSWWDDDRREHFREMLPAEVFALNPIDALEGWREIPFQAIHAQQDQWVPFGRQQRFVSALKARYRDPPLVDFIVYDRTGAPHEHIGFGKMSADAKDRQRDFLKRWLEHPATV